MSGLVNTPTVVAAREGDELPSLASLNEVVRRLHASIRGLEGKNGQTNLEGKVVIADDLEVTGNVGVAGSPLYPIHVHASSAWEKSPLRPSESKIGVRPAILITTPSEPITTEFGTYRPQAVIAAERAGSPNPSRLGTLAFTDGQAALVIPQGTSSSFLNLGFNNEVSTDLGIRAAKQDRVYLTRSTPQSTTSSVTTLITFDQEEFDVTDMHDNVTNNSRITIRTEGLYLIGLHCSWQTNSAGQRRLSLLLNGSFFLGESTTGNADLGPQMSLVTILPLVVNDYIEYQVRQDASTTLTVTPRFWAYRLP